MIKTIFKFTHLTIKSTKLQLPSLHLSPLSLSGRNVYVFSTGETAGNVEGSHI